MEKNKYDYNFEGYLTSYTIESETSRLRLSVTSDKRGIFTKDMAKYAPSQYVLLEKSTKAIDGITCNLF